MLQPGFVVDVKVVANLPYRPDARHGNVRQIVTDTELDQRSR